MSDAKECSGARQARVKRHRLGIHPMSLLRYARFSLLTIATQELAVCSHRALIYFTLTKGSTVDGSVTKNCTVCRPCEPRAGSRSCSRLLAGPEARAGRYSFHG